MTTGRGRMEDVFEDTKLVFGMEPLYRMVGSAFFYKLCSYQNLVSTLTRILSSNSPFVWPLKAAMKRTVFTLFVAGEDFASCQKTIQDLQTSYSVGSIVDHSIEEEETEEAFFLNLESKMKLLRELSFKINKGLRSNERETQAVKFIPLKMTALMCPTTLESITARLFHLHNDTNDAIDDAHVLSKLTGMERKAFQAGLNRLEILCAVAEETGISLLIDAEQSQRQGAIELIYRILGRKINCNSPILYNTYQMYLRQSISSLRRDLEHAKANDFVFACKIVRGAYMQSESLRADKESRSNPVLDNKSETNSSYNNAAEFLLSTIQKEIESQSIKKTAVVFATHNRQSIIKITNIMGESIPRNCPQIHFAQIKGMGDNLSNGLGLAGFNVCKLIPFGSFNQVLPWLLRRLQENSSFFEGAMQDERKLFAKEIRRRLGVSTIFAEANKDSQNIAKSRCT